MQKITQEITQTQKTKALPKFSDQSNGEGFAADALPFHDLSPEQPREFEREGAQVMLRGSRSRSSGSMAFPARAVCMETGARDMEPFYFGPYGTLYSFSTVHVSATRDTPYTIGYVDFPNGVRILANVEWSEAADKAGAEILGAALQCDMRVEVRAVGDRWFVVPVGMSEPSEQSGPSGASA
jgi:uncharacterized OB-fold protein